MPNLLSLTNFLVHIGFYAASIALVGVLLCKVFKITTGLRRAVLFVLIFLSAMFFLMELLIANAQMGENFASTFNPETFFWVWQLHKMQALVLAFGLVGACAAPLLNSKLAALVSALAISASYGSTGHTQALENSGFAPVLVGLHILIAGYWVIAPMILWPYQTTISDILIQRMERYSTFARYLIPALFISGLYLAWVLAGGFVGLTTKPYGQLLLLKLCLAVFALCLGALNKFFITNKLKTDFVSGVKLLKYTLTFDLILFTMILCIIAWATSVTGISTH